MKLLLHAYPRRWRERYGNELMALLEAEPLTWRMRVDVVTAGLNERLRGSGPPQLRVLWAWVLFAIGGVAFQKTSEHWQVVVPVGERGVPTAAFDIVQAAAIVGSAAVLAGVALALPGFVQDLRRGGWAHSRRPILTASISTVIAAVALLASVWVFAAFMVVSLFAWTHAAAVGARRLQPLRAHRHLAAVTKVTMLVMTVAAGVWFAAVTGDAPSFVGTAQLVVMATCMLGGDLVAARA